MVGKPYVHPVPKAKLTEDGASMKKGRGKGTPREDHSLCKDVVGKGQVETSLCAHPHSW